MAWKEIKTFGEVPVGAYKLKVKAVQPSGAVTKVDVRLHTEPREDGNTHTGKGFTIAPEAAKALVKVLQTALKELK